MTYKTHINFGLFLLMILVMNFCICNNIFIAIGVTVIGAILPDIDHNMSYISKRKILILIILFVILKLNLIQIILIIIWCIISRKTGHRKLSHSLLSVIFFLILLYNSKYCLYFIIGFISHLILDILSNGISLLYPMSNKRLGISLIKTNSVKEKILMYILIIINLILLIEFLTTNYLTIFAF